MMRRVIAAATIAGVLVLTAAAAVAVSRFTDVADDHPSAAEIESAAAEGWMLGYGDGTFGPDQTLTESQLAKIISRVFDDLRCPTDECEGITRAEAAVFAVAGADAVKARRANPVVVEPDGEPGGGPGGGPGEEPGGGPGEEPGGEPSEEPTVTQPPTSAPPAQAAPTPEERCLRLTRWREGWHANTYFTNYAYHHKLTASGEGDNLECLVSEIWSPGSSDIDNINAASHLYFIEVYNHEGVERRRVRRTSNSGYIFQSAERMAEHIEDDVVDGLTEEEARSEKMLAPDIFAAFFQAREAGSKPPAVPARFLGTAGHRTYTVHDPWVENP